MDPAWCVAGGGAGISGGGQPRSIGVIRRSVEPCADRADPEDTEANPGGNGEGHGRRDEGWCRGGTFRVHQSAGKARDRDGRRERIAGKNAQRTHLASWHLELSAGQYRGPHDQRTDARVTKLVHNIVLSMPAPTPPEKVLAAVRVFAREKFAVRHRYALVLHTDQAHPHVHLVVKAEDMYGKRLHIGKPMLREWREDFARMMREQGIAANATPRVVRGRNKGKRHDGILRAQGRRDSTALRARVTAIAAELAKNGRYSEAAARAKLVETRKAVVANWLKIAEAARSAGRGRPGLGRAVLREASFTGSHGYGEVGRALHPAPGGAERGISGA